MKRTFSMSNEDFVVLRFPAICRPLVAKPTNTNVRALCCLVPLDPRHTLRATACWHRYRNWYHRVLVECRPSQQYCRSLVGRRAIRGRRATRQPSASRPTRNPTTPQQHRQQQQLSHRNQNQNHHHHHHHQREKDLILMTTLWCSKMDVQHCSRTLISARSSRQALASMRLLVEPPPHLDQASHAHPHSPPNPRALNANSSASRHRHRRLRSSTVQGRPASTPTTPAACRRHPPRCPRSASSSSCSSTSAKRTSSRRRVPSVAWCTRSACHQTSSYIGNTMAHELQHSAFRYARSLACHLRYLPSLTHQSIVRNGRPNDDYDSSMTRARASSP